MALMASYELVEEPEFDEIIVDPLLCVETFIQVGEELGMDPASLGNLPDEERKDVQIEMLEKTTRQLLTDELRQDVLNGLNSLRLRQKRSGKLQEAALAAALQSFLDADKEGTIWSIIGLVQAIVQRSLATGFELFEASMAASETIKESKGGAVPLLQKLSQSSLGQKADELLTKVPGLSKFVEKQSDKVWEEGVTAIYEGELYLGLYSPEELAAGLDIIETLFRDVIVQDSKPEQAKVSKESGETLIAQVNDYIGELFTSERLDQLRARLDTVLNELEPMDKWLAFTLMLVEYMKDSNAAEYERAFLVKSFFGEIRMAAAVVFEGSND